MKRVKEPDADARRALLATAHHLKPIVIIGHNGVSESLISAVNVALDAHELIKIKFNEFKEEKSSLSETIAKSTSSQLLGIIGNMAILYRPHHN